MFRKKIFFWGTVWLVLLTACNSNIQHLSDADVNYIENDDSLAEDEGIDDFIKPYREDLNKEMNIVVGLLPEDLVKSKPNSNLGNWFCDMLKAEAESLSKTKIDFAIQNYGGLRVPSIAKGPLTKGEIFELMPFDNMLVILEVKGSIIQKMANGMAQYGGWPISKGFSFKIDDEKAMDIKVNDKPLELDKTYRIAMPDYVANGGDKAGNFKDIEQENLGFFIRDIIINRLSKLSEEGEEIFIDNSKRIF